MNKIVLIVILCCAMSLAMAKEVPCYGRFINPITDICWRCLFPISLGATELVKSKLPDTKNNSSIICHCHGHLGLSIGFWEPIEVVDVTRVPFCFTSLGGLRVNAPSLEDKQVGGVWLQNDDTLVSQYHLHVYYYPLLAWLNIITDLSCSDEKFELPVWVSEYNPQWNVAKLNKIFNPSFKKIATVKAQKLCQGEALKIKSGHHPIDELYWCAGAQGSMFPLWGQVSNQVSGVQGSLLLVERQQFYQHSRGSAKDSGNSKGKTFCTPESVYFLPKSRYRLQMLYPVAATSRETGCKPFGYPTYHADFTIPQNSSADTSLLGEANIEKPKGGEDFAYLTWRKRNCCGG